MDANAALEQLRDRSGEVAGSCKRRAAILLTCFGSTTRPGSDPHDLDLGVLFEYGGPRDVLGLLDDLTVLTRYDGIDLTVLNDAGPVICEHALVGVEVLFEARRSVHAESALAATMERLDTAWLRRLTLETLAR